MDDGMTKEDRVIYGVYSDLIEKCAWELAYVRATEAASLQREFRGKLENLIWKVVKNEGGENA